jgi:hypothetical protein
MVAVALDATIKGYDFRSPKEAYSIDKAHAEGTSFISFLLALLLLFVCFTA